MEVKPSTCITGLYYLCNSMPIKNIIFLHRLHSFLSSETSLQDDQNPPHIIAIIDGLRHF